LIKRRALTTPGHFSLTHCSPTCTNDKSIKSRLFEPRLRQWANRRHTVLALIHFAPQQQQASVFDFFTNEGGACHVRGQPAIRCSADTTTNSPHHSAEAFH
jgi:hypothetical protein